MPRSSSDPGEENPGNNLYIANLSYKTTEEDLKSLFSPCGAIKECNVVLDPMTKESRGFAFLMFESAQEAERAIEEVNGKDLNGRKLRVEKARRSKGHGPTPGRYMGKARRSSRKFHSGERSYRSHSRSDDHRRRSRSRSSPRRSRRSRSHSYRRHRSRNSRSRD